MYYDLEFPVKHNAGLTTQGDHLADVVLELTARELLERFGIGIDLGKDVVELDSSTETKWSRHLIIHWYVWSPFLRKLIHSLCCC